MKQRVKIGLIGVGRHGLRYANHLVNDVPEAEFISASGRMNKQFEGWMERYPGTVEFFSDHLDLLNSDIDAVIIVTPTGTHENYAMDALDRGKHVLVEKPMAGSKEECVRMIDRADAAGSKLMVSQTLRYNPTIIRMREIFRDMGDISEIIIEQHLEPPDRKWLFDRSIARGGVLLNTGVHLFDTLRFITGLEVRPITCSTFRIKNPNLEDLAFGTASLGDTIDVRFSVSRFFGSRGRTIWRR